MKRTLVVLLVGLVTLLVLREAGILSFSAYKRDAQYSIMPTCPLEAHNVSGIVYQKDSARPLAPYVKNRDDLYKARITYSVRSSLSPWRWLPLFKFGENEAQLIYLVWIEDALMGCGSVYTKGRQTVWGSSSAREYRDQIVDPLIEQMKRDVSSKLRLIERG